MTIKEYVKKLIPDKVYLKRLYKNTFNKKLNLKNPQTFNEKLQWLKLNDRKEIYTTLVDKYEVKKYIANIIGEEYIIPTLGIYDKFDDIDFDKLPNKFVIKCTHDSGSTIVCKNKDEFDIQDAKRTIENNLRKNFYYNFREWPYKNVKPRIIIEEYLEDKIVGEIRDYKFLCYNGNAKYVMVCCDRNIQQTKYYFFNKNWKFKKFDASTKDLNNSEEIYKPKQIDKMFKIAEQLSKDIKFVRVDLYYINEKIYFGEMTFYPLAGFDTAYDEKTDLILGKDIKID